MKYSITLNDLNSINSTINHINNLLSCSSIQNTFQNAIETGFCTQMYNGFYILNN